MNFLWLKDFANEPRDDARIKGLAAKDIHVRIVRLLAKVRRDVACLNELHKRVAHLVVDTEAHDLRGAVRNHADVAHQALRKRCNDGAAANRRWAAIRKVKHEMVPPCRLAHPFLFFAVSARQWCLWSLFAQRSAYLFRILRMFTANVRSMSKPELGTFSLVQLAVPSVGADLSASMAMRPPPFMVLALDVSGSMKPCMPHAVSTALAAVDSLPNGAQLKLVTFDTDTNVVLDKVSQFRPTLTLRMRLKKSLAAA